MRRQSTNPSPRETRRHPDTTVVDHAWCLVVALARGKQHHGRCCGGQGAPPRWNACRPSGGTVLLALSWIEHLGQPWLPSSAWLEFVGGEQVPWPSSLARGPYGWAQVGTFATTGLLIAALAVAVRDELPHRRASSFAVVLLALLGVALLLAAFGLCRC